MSADQKAKNNKIALFYPGVLPSKSPNTFEIPFGGQQTIIAIGLQEQDYIEFEMLNVPGVDQDMCVCTPVNVSIPTATGYELLKFCGKAVRVTSDSPVAILSAPQGVKLRAVRHVRDERESNYLFVWAISSQSRHVDQHLSGLCYLQEWDTQDFADNPVAAPDDADAKYFNDGSEE